MVTARERWTGAEPGRASPRRPVPRFILEVSPAGAAAHLSCVAHWGRLVEGRLLFGWEPRKAILSEVEDVGRIHVNVLNDYSQPFSRSQHGTTNNRINLLKGEYFGTNL